MRRKIYPKMDDEPTWVKFWKLSAEHANEAMRIGKILPDATLSVDNNENEKSISDLLFRNTHRYYLDNLLLMDTEINKQTLKRDTTLYRNVFNDIYHEIDEDDEFQNTCFTSCFIDKYNNEYGDFSIEIRVPRGTHYLEYDNNIILPPGNYRLIERNHIGYVIEFIEQIKLFDQI